MLKIKGFDQYTLLYCEVSVGHLLQNNIEPLVKPVLVFTCSAIWKYANKYVPPEKWRTGYKFRQFSKPLKLPLVFEHCNRFKHCFVFLSRHFPAWKQGCYVQLSRHCCLVTVASFGTWPTKQPELQLRPVQILQRLPHHQWGGHSPAEPNHSSLKLWVVIVSVSDEGQGLLKN